MNKSTQNKVSQEGHQPLWQLKSSIDCAPCMKSLLIYIHNCVSFYPSLSQFTPVFSNPLPLLITALIGNVLRTIDIGFSEANSIVSSEFGTLRIAENLVVNHAKFDTPFTLYAFNLISKRLYQHPSLL